MNLQKNKLEKIFFALALSALMLVGAATINVSKVAAQTITTDRLDVEITVNKDSTFTVSETATLTFNGQSRGVIRGITLQDPYRDYQCAANTGLTCGDFEYVSIDAVYDSDGDLVDPAAYEIGIQSDEDTNERYLVVTWEVWPGGKYLQDQQFTWTLEYTIYGGLIYDTDATYIYWNALYEGRSSVVDNANILLNLPSGDNTDSDYLQVYTVNNQSYRVADYGNSIAVSMTDLPISAGAVTIAYPINKQAVDMFATLDFDQNFPLGKPDISFNGSTLESVSSPLLGLPTGQYELTFARPGFEPLTIDIDAESGEEISFSYSLSPTAANTIVIGIVMLLNFLGLLLIPLGVYIVYSNWSNKGRDVKMPKTIIPIYQPPKDVRPYLLGSVKDESVDKEDITSAIIDLAYRGHLKITELDKAKNYRLNRMQSDDSDLDEVEKQLIKALFGSKAEIETKDLKNKFYTKYQRLTKKVAQEMVARGYFDRLPDTVRAQYYGAGGALLAIGVVGTVLLSFPFIDIISFFGPFMIGVAGIVTGVAYLVAAPHMPAKTEKGSKLYSEILGFKMYMDFAERYRVQNLKPEEFEKYLSYAVAFGIEKSWAKKFEGIYSGHPDWYESDSIDAWDVYVLSNFTRNFSNNLNSVVYTPVQSNTASGGGWSSGGFSGGFSGGGGGGGFGGGF